MMWEPRGVYINIIGVLGTESGTSEDVFTTNVWVSHNYESDDKHE